MRLTNYSDYALRSLIYLATKPEPHLLANISDIANSYHISRSHLTKIIHQLGQLGYIDSVRGKNGGIRLACAPKDINLGVLIKQIEPDFNLVECFSTDLSINPKPDNANSDSSFNSNDDNAVAKALPTVNNASLAKIPICLYCLTCNTARKITKAIEPMINKSNTAAAYSNAALLPAIVMPKPNPTQPKRASNQQTKIPSSL